MKDAGAENKFIEDILQWPHDSSILLQNSIWRWEKMKISYHALYNKLQKVQISSLSNTCWITLMYSQAMLQNPFQHAWKKK